MLILKLLDKIATAQFQAYIDNANLLHKGQSGFRKGYSTETALLQLLTQLRHSLENNKAALLILLDLSAAYDLVDHNILGERLRASCNCSVEACTWFLSFLSNRRSKVTWDSAESPTENLIYGVPQGSCLSPTLFNVYLTPLFNILEELGIEFTNYADDTQVLLELTGNHETDNNTLNSIYSTIKKWMDANWMCLNGTKTELIIISSKRKRQKLGPSYTTFNLENTDIPVVNEVKTLGVTLDAQLTMTPHCDKIYNTSQYHLKLLKAIRPLISETHCSTLARATITSRLDYCNSILTNTTKANIGRLQSVQNSAVRIISNTPLREHVTAARQALHWLPVASRIDYKILSLTHKCVHGKAPPYLAAHIKQYATPRCLRSTDKNLLNCPKALKKSGNRSSFAFTGPTCWNKLPQHLREVKEFEAFKKDLKTHLFH